MNKHTNTFLRLVSDCGGQKVGRGASLPWAIWRGKSKGGSSSWTAPTMAPGFSPFGYEERSHHIPRFDKTHQSILEDKSFFIFVCVFFIACYFFIWFMFIISRREIKLVCESTLLFVHFPMICLVEWLIFLLK